MKPREKFLQFVVKDYGRGIEKSQFQNIFKPFQQASADTERLYGGTGLGLTITSRLVEALGGKISVDSSLGEWSEFVVSLPLKGEQSTNISNSIDQSVRESSIFLVSGDKQATEQIVQVFKEWQIQCIPVPSMQGVKHFLDQNPERRQRRCICLVEETLFDDRSFNTLSRKTSTALLTFGPQYSVKATAAHFRSLVGVLPCVLMDALVSALQKRCHPNQGYHSSAPAPRDDQKLPSVVDIRKLRILVAEDNMINQKVLGRMLQNLGVQRVDFVDNGRKAVDQAAIQDYECVLMDYQMPCMNGVEACRLILGKGQENEPNASKRQKRHLPKVVFVTAHASEIFELECRQAGAVGFLPKPFKLENIQKCLQNLVCTAVAETAS